MALRWAVNEHTKKGERPNLQLRDSSGDYSAYGKRVIRMGRVFGEGRDERFSTQTARQRHTVPLVVVV